MEAEKTYQNKVARTIQQKRNSEGALEFADNRQCGIFLHNPITIKTKGIIQKVDTNLHVQNGPTCWLTVLESMAATFPELKLNTLRNILTMYASKEEINESKDEVNDIGYIKGLRVTKEKINIAYNTIIEKHNNSNNPKNTNPGKIRQDKLYKVLNRISPSVARITDHLPIEKGEIKYEDIKNILKKATDKLTEIISSFKGNTWIKQIEISTNSVQVKIDKNNDFKVFKSLMESTFSLPAYAGINEGIKNKQLPYEDTDFTTQTLKIEKYKHAIQIVEYGTAGKELVKYKDPNRGNFVYTVTWDQFRSFAGDSCINIFSYNNKDKVPQFFQDL